MGAHAGENRLVSRFRFALRDGPVLAWGVTFVVCLFAPGSWADRAFAFGVVTVLLMISVFVRYARRNKRGGPLQVSSDRTAQLGLAHLPPVRSIQEHARLGMFVSGPYRRCHFACGIDESGEVWLLVASRWWPHRIRRIECADARQLRELFERWRGRCLPLGPYSDALAKVVFELDMQPM